MLKDFIDAIRPVHDGDRREWAALGRQAAGAGARIIWYASSGLDIYPVVAAALGRIPGCLSSQFDDSILVMSDYSPNYLNTLKQVYDKLGSGPVNVFRKGASSMHFDELRAFACNVDGGILRGLETPVIEAYVDQMIPFTLWQEPARDEFKTVYEYHPCPTSHPVPDEKWHFVYFLLRVVVGGAPVHFPIVFAAAENLLLFEEICQRYGIPVAAFLAVRVGGKSGSWDYTHDFVNGKLPAAIQRAEPYLRPRYWALDQSGSESELPPSFQKVATIDGLGYGGCSVFRTKWTAVAAAGSTR